MNEKFELKKLEEVCDVFADGDWVESKDQSPKGIRLIQTGNIGEGFFKDRGGKARYISEATFRRLRCTEIFEGDCLISRLPDPVGRCCLMPNTGEKMITAVDCTIVRFNRKQIVPKYFSYFSQSATYLSLVESETSGTTRKRISRKKLGQIPLPVPPLSEQKRIVAILDEAFTVIATAKENAEKNLKNAREIFNSYLQRVFAKPDDRWDKKTLGEVCTLRSGTTLPPRLEKPVGELPYLKVADMNLGENIGLIRTSSRFVDRSDVNGNGVIPIGSTIFPKRGGAILTNKKRLTSIPILMDLNLMAVTPKKEISPAYLYNFFLNLDLREINNGSSIPQINNYSIEPLVIYFPALPEQEQIVSRLDALASETKRLAAIYEKKLTCLDELRKSILEKAFSGKL